MELIRPDEDRIVVAQRYGTVVVTMDKESAA